MIAIGIDPGLTGAVAAIYGAGRVEIRDLPTLELPGGGLVKRRIDGLALAHMLRALVPIGQTARVIVEAVNTMGGQNNALQTQGSLMRSLGAIEAVCEVLRMPPEMVQPKAWKKRYALGSDKGESMRVALSLYPSAPLKLVKHHNRAEALLLAHLAVIDEQRFQSINAEEGAF